MGSPELNNMGYAKTARVHSTQKPLGDVRVRGVERGGGLGPGKREGRGREGSVKRGKKGRVRGREGVMGAGKRTQHEGKGREG